MARDDDVDSPLDEEPEPRKRRFPLWGWAILGVALLVGAGFAGVWGVKVASRARAGIAKDVKADGNNQQPAAVPVAPKNDPPDVVDQGIAHAYSENRIAADDKYKGRRVVITDRVEEISEVNGRAVVAFCRINGISTYSPLRGGGSIGPSSAPIIYCFVENRKDPTLLKLKRGDRCKVVGTVLGRFDDDVFRNLRGYEFTIRIESESLEIMK